MIDTIKLNIVDCTISSDAALIVEPSPYIYNSEQEFMNYDLFVDTEGVLTTGKKAYLNHPKFNLTIKPKYFLEQDEQEKTLMYDTKMRDGKKFGVIQNIKIEAEKFNAGIFVQTSLPRYNNTNNFNAISFEDEKKVLNKLEKDLKEAGIKTNIWESNLSRIDIFQNIITDENFHTYSSLFEVLQLPRLERFEYNGTTFLYKNNERQICIYDKILEMRNKIKDQTLYRSLRQNVMRIETRYLKKRKIKSALNYFTLKDVFKNYDYLRQNYRKEIEESIFRYTPQELEIMTGNFIAEDMQHFYTRSKYWLSNYFKMMGVVSLLKLSNLETIIEKIYEIIDRDENKKYKNKRMIKSRLKRQMEELKFRMESSKLNLLNSLKTNKDLYNELKEKFYKLAS